MGDKKKRLRVVEGSPCAVRGGLHAALVADDGKVVSVGHTREAVHGEPLRPGEDMILVDPEGHVVDRIQGPRAGPPKVTSDAYRSGWDAVFGNDRASAPN